MPKYLTLTEARQKLLDLPDEFADEPAIVTECGKPVMAVMSYDKFQSIVGTLDILSDEKLAAQLREGIQQAPGR